MLKTTLKNVINLMLAPVGLEMSRSDATLAKKYAQLGKQLQHLQGKFGEAVTDLEGAMTHCLFQDLPSCANRTKLLTELFGTSVAEAFYLLHYLHASFAFEGDVCEFGIAYGSTSALLANELRTSVKRLWLFDSFAGLPKPSEKDQLINDIFNLGSIEKYQGQMQLPQEEVLQRLSSIQFPAEKTMIVSGLIEATAKTGPLPERICFAYIDFDFYEPTKTALDLVDRRLSVGCTVIVDDYGWFSSGAQTAVDEFMESTQGRYRMDLPVSFAGHFCMLTKLRE